MVRTMGIQADLARVLVDAGLEVDTTLRGVAYNDGRCWVLLDSWEAGGDGESLTVVAALTPGDSRLDSLIDQVHHAIANSDQFAPVAFQASYGAPPIAGRSMPPADYAEITVASGRERQLRGGARPR